jgi:LPPG:FO 2-phospho-L-lactate transferase
MNCILYDAHQSSGTDIDLFYNALSLLGVIVLFLSGGTGTPKLIRGMVEVVAEEEIKVIVNTGDDLWVSGNLVCPDIDTVLYTLAKIIDDKWWGIKGDTFQTFEKLSKLGHLEPLAIGDLDRATHIYRTFLMHQGMRLTEATRELAKSYKIQAEVLPMTDDPVPTAIVTEIGEMHIQNYLIKHRSAPRVFTVKYDSGSMNHDVKTALKAEDSIIIGPSNPISSIGPIINVKGVKSLLKRKFVLAISPIIGSEPISGPAKQFMESGGLDSSSEGVAEFYEEFLDVLVIDNKDVDVSRQEIKRDIKVVRTNTMMRSLEDSKLLAEDILKLV